MITITANARRATFKSDDLITSGSVGIPVEFVLSDDFDGLSSVAVFEGSGASVDVALMSDACVVPPEVVATAGGYLRIGVYARNSEGTIVIPTVWVSTQVILPGAKPSGVDPSQPTPDWTAQVQEAAAEALSIAQNVAGLSVASDTLVPGSSATVAKSVDPDTGAVTLSFGIPRGDRGEQGPQGVPGERGETGDTGPQGVPGTPGQDGVSPTATVTQTATGATITITDAEGTTTAEITNGQDGAPGAPGSPGTPGEDGFSPTITVTDITGGHRVTITDADGPHSFDVMDGDAADAPVQDVQVNGTSILQDGVANMPYAQSGRLGVIYTPSNSAYGLSIGANGLLCIAEASENDVKAGGNDYKPITPKRQTNATFYGLAKAAGADMASSSNPVGTYTDAAKVAIQKMLGIYEAPWGLIREDTFTNETEADHIITADGNGQALELTDAIILFETKPQANEAKFSGSIFLYVSNGGNSNYKLECGSWTQAANTSGHGCGVVAKQNSGMFELYRIGQSTNSNTGALGMRYGANFGIGSNSDRVMFRLAPTPIIITKVVIAGVLGTGHYYFYGKRKWN